jgi:uncharacterized protein YcbK (DUF882 family)
MTAEGRGRGRDAGSSRRAFLGQLGTGIAAAAILPAWTRPLRGAVPEPLVRSLSFEHLHTGESLSVRYVEDGSYVPQALGEIDHVLRDHYNGAVHPIDPKLLDILHAVARETGAEAPFQVISGYRSPETNERLRKQGRGVARNSMHLQGKAVDVRVADVPTTDLREAGLALALGGVGYYRASDFVHFDSGRVRRW